MESLDLFMSRSSLTETEFEQYSISGDSLFSECGLVERGRFVAKVQNVTTIAPDTASELVAATFAVHQLVKEKRPSFDPPGTKASPFDPGTYALKSSCGGEPLDIKTSFDAVVNGETKPTAALGKLTKTLRLAAANGCGGRNFFGLTPLKR